MSSWQDYVDSYSVQPDSRGFFRVGNSDIWVNTYQKYKTLSNLLGSLPATISGGAGEVAYFAEGGNFYAVYTIAGNAPDKTITVSEAGVVDVLLVGAGGDAGNVPGAGLEQTIRLEPGDYTATIGAQGGSGAAGGDTSFATLTASGGLGSPATLPTVTATVTLSDRTVTVEVTGSTGNPTPTFSLTTLTLDGVDVLGDAVGAGPWTYGTPSSPSAQTVAATVAATNTEGTDTASGSVSVPADLTAPAQMSAPSLAVDSATQITATLAGAPANGGSAITSYDLRYSTDEATWTTASGVTSPVAITGLTGGTLYYVQTRAVNAVGAGAWSTSATATTNAVTVAPAISGVPTIAGTETEGETLTATAASVTGDPTPTRTWQWERGGVAIAGATSATYTLTADDVGATLTVVQTESNTAGSDTAESLATGTITAAAGGGFAPTDLFAASESGAWYDPSDLTSMNTLSDGTGTQPAVGDPVGRIEDKSGNANHALQATAANRPILRQTVSGEYYLEFDGVNDLMSFANPITGSNPHSCFIGVGVNGTSQNIWNVGVNSAVSRRTIFSNVGFGVNGGNEQYTPDINGSTVVLGSIYPASGTRADAHICRVDGAERAASSEINGYLALNTSGTIGEIGGAGGTSGEVDIFGFVLIDREITTTEIDDTETYLADKAGVTL